MKVALSIVNRSPSVMPFKVVVAVPSVTVTLIEKSPAVSA